jgi:hypothetical protein
MRQMNFDTKIDELTRKPQSHITQEDAREIQATEVCRQTSVVAGGISY